MGRFSSHPLGRGFKLAGIFLFMRHFVMSLIITGKANIMEGVVGEKRTTMTIHALSPLCGKI